MARKERARPYFTMSGGSCNMASSAASDLDNSRVPEETREAAGHQRENQAANRIQECHVCRFAFTETEAFEKHTADHSLGKSNNCSECGRLFKKPWNLKRHLRTHGEPSFECGVCGKRYCRKEDLEKHVLVRHVGAQDWEAFEGTP
ncbi:zinc finger X-chromosomal protein-like isoform X2 [Dermacentor variabilis]|uniref:zinc finger X-chromosomal protein-like isoform X2 n=1 Tax=Dermacentor variabilis TaxID=34621 RepID=UPI003F5B6A4C